MLLSLLNLLFPQSAISQEIQYSYTQQLKTSSIILNNYWPNQEKPVNTDYQYLPIAGERKARKVFHLTVTAYSSTVDQCDSDPFTTASGKKVRDGIIAYNYLPFGTKVRFPDIFPGKVFVVEDRLRAGASIYLADIWVPTREEALQWGAKTVKIEVL